MMAVRQMKSLVTSALARLHKLPCNFWRFGKSRDYNHHHYVQEPLQNHLPESAEE